MAELDWLKSSPRSALCQTIAGIYEWVQDLYPLVKYFCETTGQKLVNDPDAVTGATYRRNSSPDAATGASTKAAAEKEVQSKVKEKVPDDATTAASLK